MNLREHFEQYVSPHPPAHIFHPVADACFRSDAHAPHAPSQRIVREAGDCVVEEWLVLSSDDDNRVDEGFVDALDSVDIYKHKPYP
jgi:hypothetical protein